MGRARGIRAALMCAVAFAVALFLTACGTKVVLPHGAEQAIAGLVSRQTGFTPTDVHCPSGIHARAGATFQCHFTGPHGVPYTAVMKVNKVQGMHVLFSIHAKPTGK